MDEPTAWLYQARADWQAAERFVAGETGTGRCHAIAKWQQAVEKSVKALVSALHGVRILGAGIRPRHEVEPYLAILLRLPRAPGNRTIQQQLDGLLDQNTQAGMRALDSLAPRFPSRRNTGYPFQDARGQWTYPAAEGLFSADEARQFRKLASRVLNKAGIIVSSIRRQPG